MRHDKAISRRTFTKCSAVGLSVLSAISNRKAFAHSPNVSPLRLGGHIHEKFEDPDGWVEILKRLGYRAAYCPVRKNVSDEVINAYARAARNADASRWPHRRASRCATERSGPKVWRMFAETRGRLPPRAGIRGRRNRARRSGTAPRRPV